METCGRQDDVRAHALHCDRRSYACNGGSLVQGSARESSPLPQSWVGADDTAQDASSNRPTRVSSANGASKALDTTALLPTRRRSTAIVLCAAGLPADCTGASEDVRVAIRGSSTATRQCSSRTVIRDQHDAGSRNERDDVAADLRLQSGGGHAVRR